MTKQPSQLEIDKPSERMIDVDMFKYVLRKYYNVYDVRYFSRGGVCLLKFEYNLDKVLISVDLTLKYDEHVKKVLRRILQYANFTITHTKVYRKTFYTKKRYDLGKDGILVEVSRKNLTARDFVPYQYNKYAFTKKFFKEGGYEEILKFLDGKLLRKYLVQKGITPNGSEKKFVFKSKKLHVVFDRETISILFSNMPTLSEKFIRYIIEQLKSLDLVDDL